MKRLTAKAFTLIELLVVVGIIALLISILLPSLSKAREVSRRTACGANMKAIGTSCLVYSEANRGVLPTPAVSGPNATNPNATTCFNQVGNNRAAADGYTSATGGSFTTSQNSNTRGYFKLLMGGNRAYMQPKQMICPSSSTLQHKPKGCDVEGFRPGLSTGVIVRYFDFDGQTTDGSKSEMKDFSYSFQVSMKMVISGTTYGTILTNTQDPRKAIAADRNPYSNDVNTSGTSRSGIYNYSAEKYVFGFAPPPNQSKLYGAKDLNAALRKKNANSRNHNLEGQNVAYLDGHAKFSNNAKSGADEDCIWVAQTDSGGSGVPVGDLDPASVTGDAWGKQLNMPRSNWLTDSVLAP